VAHLSVADRLAAGLRPPASLNRQFAAVQAAWRFYGNERVSLPDLSQPLVECARADIPDCCDRRVLVALDWCGLHFSSHTSRNDRVPLAQSRDLGYDVLTALAISDRGAPIAPLCVELRAADGLHTTRLKGVGKPDSKRDGLTPVLAHVTGLGLPKLPVFVIDREADSVGLYRAWMKQGWEFLVRANDARLVRHGQAESTLGQVADGLKLALAGEVQAKGKPARQFVGETTVELHRPARQHRVGASGVKRHRNVEGEPIKLRLVVSEIRDLQGKRIARWLLLCSVADADATTIARWYYWRWRIESYHKLLKSAGQHVEGWQQEAAAAFARRLLVAAMSAVMVWRLAREQGPEASHLRDELVRLSGRQMKRGKTAKKFTEPALLAGLGTLVSMLEYLRNADLAELIRLTEKFLPGLLPLPRPDPPTSNAH
jgi:hypothetical protein